MHRTAEPARVWMGIPNRGIDLRNNDGNYGES